MEINGKTAYKTSFLNKTKSTITLDEDGKTFVKLEPGDEWSCYSGSPFTTYAAWERIVFEKDGSITKKKNHEWKNPYPPDSWVTLFENIDGAKLESVNLFNQPVPIYKGFERLLAVDPSSPWVYYKRIAWLRRKISKPDPAFPMYQVTSEEIVIEKELRDPKDLEKIKAQQLEMIKAAAERDLRSTIRRLPQEVRLALKGE